MSPPLHHIPPPVWCNASDSPRTHGSTYQVLYESFSHMIFAISHIPDTRLQGLRQTHVMETIWIILGLYRSRNAARLVKDFVLLSSGALLFVALNSQAHSAHDALLCFCWGQMPQREMKVWFGRPTWPQNALHLVFATLESWDAQVYVTSHQKIHRWFSLMSAEAIEHGAPPDLRLWRWNIPGKKRDMLVWKGAFR